MNAYKKHACAFKPLEVAEDELEEEDTSLDKAESEYFNDDN